MDAPGTQQAMAVFQVLGFALAVYDLWKGKGRVFAAVVAVADVFAFCYHMWFLGGALLVVLAVQLFLSSRPGGAMLERLGVSLQKALLILLAVVTLANGATMVPFHPVPDAEVQIAGCRPSPNGPELVRPQSKDGVTCWMTPLTAGLYCVQTDPPLQLREPLKSTCTRLWQMPPPNEQRYRHVKSARNAHDWPDLPFSLLDPLRDEVVLEGVSYADFWREVFLTFGQEPPRNPEELAECLRSLGRRMLFYVEAGDDEKLVFEPPPLPPPGKSQLYRILVWRHAAGKPSEISQWQAGDLKPMRLGGKHEFTVRRR